jgi:hypothetical protein
MSGAITTVFHALCAPFSPLCLVGGGNNDKGSNESRGGYGDGNDSNDDDDDDPTMVVGGAVGVETVMAVGNDHGTTQQKKCKRAEKSTTNMYGIETKAARKEMLMKGELCQYYQTSLEKRTECGNISSCFCLQVLKDAHICLSVTKYLV